MSREIGKGSYSKVYKRNVKGVEQAMKICELDREIVKSSARELHAMHQLRECTGHISIINQFLHRGKSGTDTINIHMECADIDLHEYLKKNKVSDQCQLKWTIQLVKGLFTMHKNRMFHRDIKPDNILIKGNDVLFCDYGLTRQFSCDCVHGTAYVVTRWWRAPELLVCERHDTKLYTPEMDVWSLGVVLYEMILNKAFAHVPKEEAMDAIDLNISCLPSDCKEVDPRLRKVLQGCLVKDPKNRFNIVDCMLALQIITEDEHEELQTKMKQNGVCNKVCTPLQPGKHRYEFEEWEKRWIYFHELDKFTALNKSIKAHTLLLYDAETTSHIRFPPRIRFILCVIVACCIFGSGNESVIKHYLENDESRDWPFTEENDGWPLIALSEFICTTNMGCLSQWENGEYDWYEYVFEATMNPYKRIKRD